MHFAVSYGKTTKKESYETEKIHNTDTKDLAPCYEKILESQHRNGGLGTMLKTVLEAAGFLRLLLVFADHLTFRS